MPPPSYPHRHLLLTELLASQPDPPEDIFAVPGGEPNVRGCKLDALLLAGWSAPRRTVDHDVLQHADNLRLKRNDFDVLGRIGEGQFGVVDAVRCKLDGKVYAMKTVEKGIVQRAGSQICLAYERRLHALAKGTCPIPELVTTFQSPSSLHLVTAYASCGSLWDRMCEAIPLPGLDTGRMEEEEVAWWGRQMVGAVDWVHGQGYVHRDIKPHNFLLHSDGKLWLTDFGSAAPISGGCVARRHCLLPAGTPDYVAPEVLKLAEDVMIEAAQSMDESMDRTAQQADLDAAGYTCDVDWWSLGATLYEMAAGRAPFWAPSIGATYERVMKCDLRMPEHLSPQLKSLLSGLLSPHDVRLGCSGVSEIRSHTFFQSSSKLSPPSITPQPIDLDTLAESFVHDFDNPEFTFDMFNASTISAMTSMSIAPSPTVWSKWVGWSLDPPSDYFGDEPPASSPVRVPARALFTPLRRGNQPTPPTILRTAPRSVPRTRPVSERRAFAELVQCVQASARKKIASSKPPDSTSTVSSTSSPWRKEQPPTPTPMSREVSALHRRPLSRQSSRASEEPQPPRSWRKDDTLLARLAAVSEETHTAGHTRTRSYELKFNATEKDDTFLLKLAELERQKSVSRGSIPSFIASSTRSKESAPAEALRQLQLDLSAEVEMGNEENHARPQSTPQPVRDHTEVDAKLARMVGMGDDGMDLPVVRDSGKLKPLQSSSRASQPSDAPRQKYGGHKSMEAWHASLDRNIGSLERRLADMTARLAV